MNIRKPPLLPYQKGRCCWCGGDIPVRLKKDGTPHKVQATFHTGWPGTPDCGREYRDAMGPTAFYGRLAKRDGEQCAQCGPIAGEWVPEFGTKDRPHESRLYLEPDRPKFTPVIYRVVLQVDHKVPLWKVAHLPQHERRTYFLLGNLWLLCVACHARKTTTEAAERAHQKRLEKQRAAPQQPLRGLDGQRLV